MKITFKDHAILRAAEDASDEGNTWCPWHGSKGRAAALAVSGLLKPAGMSVAMACSLYVITEAGRVVLATYKQSHAPQPR